MFSSSLSENGGLDPIQEVEDEIVNEIEEEKIEKESAENSEKERRLIESFSSSNF